MTAAPPCRVDPQGPSPAVALRQVVLRQVVLRAVAPQRAALRAAALAREAPGPAAHQVPAREWAALPPIHRRAAPLQSQWAEALQAPVQGWGLSAGTSRHAASRA